MKNIYKLFGLLLIVSACSVDLDQSPTNIASSNSLDDFEGVLNAAYWYQTGSATPLAVMGDFRSDNSQFDESPHDEFDDFDGGVISMEGDIFRPLYSSLYKSILSANSVIENSQVSREVAEAKFLRALSYFKLVKVFGDVPVNLSAAPSTSDTSILARQPVSDIFTIIENDLSDAISGLDNSSVGARASSIAAQALLAKVHIQQNDHAAALPLLSTVINSASSAGISLLPNFADVFASNLNAEILFATQLSASISNSEYSGDTFAAWIAGQNTKADELPVELDLINAYDANDSRKASIDVSLQRSSKFSALNVDQDWTEIRFAEVILLYAEALNSTSRTADAIVELNKIRSRAGVAPTSASSQSAVAAAIQDERRLELAFEGHRWFDLVRTGTVNQEMGESINANYHLFPLPTSEIFASDEVITQNAGY